MQIFHGGQVIIKGDLLGDDADVLANLHVVIDDWESVDPGISAGRSEECGEHRYGGGFPGAIGSEKAKNLTFLDVKWNIIDSKKIAKFSD